MAAVDSEAIVTFNEWKIGKSEGQYLTFNLDSKVNFSIISIIFTFFRAKFSCPKWDPKNALGNSLPPIEG